MSSSTPVPHNGMAATQVTGTYQDDGFEILDQEDKQKTMALFEELRLSQANLIAELQAEREKNVTLKDEMKLSRAKLRVELQLEQRKIVFLKEDLKRSQAALYAEKQAHKAVKEELKLTQEKSTTELQAEKRSNLALIEELKLSQTKLMAELQAKILAERQAQSTEVEDEEELEFNDVHAVELWLEMQARKDSKKKKTVQQERFEVEISVLNETIMELREELKFTQNKFQVAEQTNTALRKDLKLLVQKMFDDQDALSQKTAEVIRFVKEKAAKEEAILRTELEVLKNQLKAHLSSNPTKADEEKEQEKAEEKQKPGTSAEASEPKERTKKKSTWRRVRRFLGFKRPQRSQESAVPASTSGI